MRVTYTAPNRAHHFSFATAMYEAGLLHAFVSGVSRFSPRGKLDSIGNKFVRADELQNLFLFSQFLRVPKTVSDELASLAKIQLDRRCITFAENSDLFMFYSGAGLNTLRSVQQCGVTCVVEAVNSHVLYQEALLREEHERQGLPFSGFHKREVVRRVAEYEAADYVLCPSEFVAHSFVTHGVPRERIHIVPYGFTRPARKPMPSVQKDSFRILYVGQVNIRKGLRYLIEAFKALKHPGKELIIVGPEATPTGLAGTPIPKGVSFRGTLKGEALQAAYENADVFVLPSIEEGSALVLGEALSYGLPIVTTENSGAANLIDNGVEGYIVAIRDSGAISSRLQQLSDDLPLRCRMREAAEARAEALAGWEECTRNLIQVLRKMHLDSKPKAEANSSDL